MTNDILYTTLIALGGMTLAYGAIRFNVGYWMASKNRGMIQPVYARTKRNSRDR